MAPADSVSRSFFEEQRENRRRTIALAAVGLLWVGLLGAWATFGNLLLWSSFSSIRDGEIIDYSVDGAIVCVVVWIAVSAVMHWRAHRALPALLGAGAPQGQTAARLERILGPLLAGAGLPQSAAGTTDDAPVVLRVWDAAGGNAFALGNLDCGAIVVTRGLLDALDDGEVEAVLAHELAHLRNGDCVLMLQAATLVSMLIVFGMYGAAIVIAAGWVAGAAFAAPFQALGDMIGDGLEGCLGALFVAWLAFALAAFALSFAFMAIVALGIPFLIASLAIGAVTSALSYSREYLADACSAQWTRNPRALARALAKLTTLEAPLPKTALGLQPLHLVQDAAGAAASRFGRGMSFLMRTHPRVEDRIEKLDQMERDGVAESLLVERQQAWAASFASFFDWRAPLLAAVGLAGLSIWGGWSIEQGSLSPTGRPGRPVVRQITMGVLTGDQVRLRTGAGTHFGILATLGQGSRFEILGGPLPDPEGLQWLRIRLQSRGRVYEGWVAAQYVRVGN